MIVGVTGASGALGRLVANGLLNLVDPADVVLTTRDPSALAEYAALGVDVRHADFTERATLHGAFRGIDRLLLISADNIGSRVSGQLAAIETATRVGVSHIAYTSIPRPEPDNPAIVAPDHRATEHALRSSGLQWTALRNNLYAELQLGAIERARATGTLITNAGDGGAAYVTRRDCAAAAVGVLTGDVEANVAFDVTGPRLVTAQDIAALAGSHVEVVLVDDDAYAAELRGSGLPADVVQLLTSMGAATRRGFLADVSDAVARLSGRPATPLEALLSYERD